MRTHQRMRDRYARRRKKRCERADCFKRVQRSGSRFEDENKNVQQRPVRSGGTGFKVNRVMLVRDVIRLRQMRVNQRRRSMVVVMNMCELAAE
jgi:hypothetical protein